VEKKRSRDGERNRKQMVEGKNKINKEKRDKKKDKYKIYKE
jgi:hypothetical protein